MSALSIALVGCGKMGSALLRGWMDASVISHVDVLEPGDVGVSSPFINHVRHAGDFVPAPNRPWDMAVLAVKPQIMEDACAALRPVLLSPGVPVLSIAAGKTLRALKSYLHADQPVIRAMPNTPAAIGKGVSVAAASAEVTPGQKHIAQQVLSAGGAVRWVEDESLMDAVTAVSGSGPAYVFYLIEVLAEAGLRAGLPAELSRDLARQTVVGSAALAAADTDTSPDVLRRNVTSPGGTTEAALSVLMDGRWQKIFDEAIEKAATRSRDLSR
jgi:pyrroline-5-carboxylate reductase